jgi:hypothetical protein
MVYPGYARQSGPDPVNTQDLATKHYVDSDWGVSAADLNTLTTGGTYIAADTNANAPPFPVGQYFLDVRHVSPVLQQRATFIAQPNLIATRMYSSGAWGSWRSPAAGLIWQSLGPPAATTGLGTIWVASSGVVPVLGRRYKITLWFGVGNNSGSTDTFIYFTCTDSQGAITLPSGRMAWIGVSVPNASTWSGSASRSWVPNSTAAITWTIGLNASSSGTHNIGQNSMELVFEDMGA